MSTTTVQSPTSFIKRPLRLGDEVYNTIYAQLMTQKILPGAKISMGNLALELGVSQTPIREALSRLEVQGLVLKDRVRGYSAARQMDRERFDHLCELRLLLEPVTARKAALRLTQAQLAELKAMAEEMGNKAGQGGTGYGEFAQLDLQFHNFIARAGGNPLITETLANLHTHMHLFRLFHHLQATTESNKEHAILIEALEARDPDRAEENMRTHVQRSFARFSHLFPESKAAPPQLPAT